MKKLMFLIAIATTLMVGISGCESWNSDTMSNFTTTLDSIVDAALPIATQLGVAAAQEYVNGQVSEGTITSEQASTINTAITSAAASLTAEKSPALKKSYWTLTSTKDNIKKEVHSKLGY